MARWLTYIKERFPLASYFLLAAGIVVSGTMLSGSHAQLSSSLIAFLGILLFFAELRLMDEFKDYKKDQIAHPERPLPRGLLGVREVYLGIRGLFVLMLLYGAAIVLFRGVAAGALYIGFTLYLWLMFREFYVGEVISSFPLIYAISHQIVLVPLCLFAVAVHAPDRLADPQALAYALTVLGAFFSYEVCRKLDPAAHPILKTYLSVYGPGRTIAIVLVLLGLAAVSAHALQASLVLWPIEAALALSLVLLLASPRRFKVIEGIATIVLLAHLWAVPAREGLVILLEKLG